MISKHDGRTLVEQVGQQFPDLLRTNTNASCFQFIGEVLKALHAKGYTEWGYVGKTGGEGQYQPPNGFPRQMGPHMLTGVSHDAIASPTQRVDLLGSGNDSSKPIYAKSTEPFWSFNPDDGPRITAIPTWTGIPPEHWRSNNPIVPYPLTGTTTVPAPQPAAPALLPYEALGGDATGMAISRVMAFDYERAHGKLDKGCGAWMFRSCWVLMSRQEGIDTADKVIAKYRPEWCKELRVPVIPVPADY